MFATTNGLQHPSPTWMKSFLQIQQCYDDANKIFDRYLLIEWIEIQIDIFILQDHFCI